MGKVGKITPLLKEYSPEYANGSIAGSLAKHGKTRIPGTGHTIIIHKEPSGRFRTGLDPEADYIKKMSPDEQEQEITRINGWLDYLKNAVSHLDLSPNGAYYTEMMKHYGRLNGHEKSVQPHKMKDGINIFDLSNPYELITYAWLRVHPKVASSYMAWRSGKASPSCLYYVDDEEYQAALQYKHKTSINKAISQMNELTPDDRRKVGRLLGLPITRNTKDEQVYNLLDEYIKDAVPNKAGKTSNLTIFNKVMSYKQENLNIRYYIKVAMDYNIYRKKGERIYLGDAEIAQTEDELVQFLTSPKNIEDLSLLQDRIKQAQGIEAI